MNEDISLRLDWIPEERPRRTVTILRFNHTGDLRKNARKKLCDNPQNAAGSVQESLEAKRLAGAHKHLGRPWGLSLLVAAFRGEALRPAQYQLESCFSVPCSLDTTHRHDTSNAHSRRCTALQLVRTSDGSCGDEKIPERTPHMGYNILGSEADNPSNTIGRHGNRRGAIVHCSRTRRKEEQFQQNMRPSRQSTRIDDGPRLADTLPSTERRRKYFEHEILATYISSILTDTIITE